LQFLDLKSFLAEGDLDKYSIKFVNKLDSKLEIKKQKGVFPYEFLNTDNYVEELNKKNLFNYEDFNSFLKQKNISEEEYDNYIDIKKYDSS
jgi:hypothetical protein